jgi:hypothetical protein
VPGEYDAAHAVRVHGFREHRVEEMVTIDQLATMIMDVAAKKQSIKDIPGPLGVRGRNSDNALIRDARNWQPSRPLIDGLKPTYAWIDAELKHTRATHRRRMSGPRHRSAERREKRWANPLLKLNVCSGPRSYAQFPCIVTHRGHPRS